MEDKRIAINEGMSELQTLKTAIHEIAHAKLHDIDLNAPKDEQPRVDRRTREVEAESVAYTVCQHYGLDTSDYSFGYVAGWSSGRELSELKSSLETIRSAAAEIINSIDANFAELQKAQDKEQTAGQEQPTREGQEAAPQPEAPKKADTAGKEKPEAAPKEAFTPETIYRVRRNPYSDSRENSHLLQAYVTQENGRAKMGDVLYTGTPEKCRELMGQLKSGELTEGDVKQLYAKAQETAQTTGQDKDTLEIDKEIIAKAAASPRKEDKTLLWFCRPSGTHCFRERDVFLKDTAPHNTWRFYMEQTSDRVLAYAIELTGTERGKIKGNLYELDYAKHYERVKEKELPADTVKLIYEHGEREIPAGQFFNGNPDYELGKFERFEAVPNDPDALQSLLQEERRSREQLPPGDFKAHIAALRDGLIETEARRIVREMKRHDTPNSPNKTHFMVELSPAFMQLAATKDTDRLFSMLPYKTLAFSKIEGRHGTYALIDKGENRDRKIRKPRPSIRAQLKADKAKTAPKKAAAKTKNHDMEV